MPLRVNTAEASESYTFLDDHRLKAGGIRCGRKPPEVRAPSRWWGRRCRLPSRRPRPDGRWQTKPSASTSPFAAAGLRCAVGTSRKRRPSTAALVGWPPIPTLPELQETRGSHYAGTAHDRFSFLPGLASDLKGVALLEPRQEEFHRERTGVFPVGELFENPREWTDSIAGNDSR